MPPQDSSIRSTMPPWKISLKTSVHPCQRDTSHYHYCSRHRRHYSRSQSHSHSHCDRSSSFRCTPHAVLPATATAYAALQLMDALITPSAMLPTGTVAPHPILAISSAGTTHHCMDQNQSHSSSSHHAAQDSQPRKIKQSVTLIL